MTRQMLLDEVQRPSSEANSSLTSFDTQLTEIVAHLTRASDSKKGEISAMKAVKKYAAICLWKFGAESPTSPLLPHGKDPLEDFDYNSLQPDPTARKLQELLDTYAHQLASSGRYFICTAIVQFLPALEHCWALSLFPSWFPSQLVSSHYSSLPPSTGVHDHRLLPPNFSTTAVFLHLLEFTITDSCLRISSSSSSSTSSTINPSELVYPELVFP
ncbi:hypothetical protein F511_32059 [Dorcoceras hygrometricum]|uniref:Uncharacterized protein n=1 Tax=Dorcoceras hygrometricum TaxID=472368 RepID=A0A2Z7BT60_9LAMI|nr:hypothetical protein F511_32059 [Dorcoceras hygrometricum]